MYFDRRAFYVLIAIMVVFGISSYLTNSTQLLYLLLTVPGVLVAITFHEFAHAFVADKLGDDTPRMEGRLSLNPLKHLDPIGSLMLLFARFGWGRPVHVNPRNYNRTMSMEKADALVSIAGPTMNFILAIILALIYCAIDKFVGDYTIDSSAILTNLMFILEFAISINVGLGVFNLIPLPPLDGSKVIKPFLSYNAKIWFENNERLFYIIFVFLWIFGILSTIISPVISWVEDGIMKLATIIF